MRGQKTKISSPGFKVGPMTDMAFEFGLDE
jgi:hypothetical protein